MEIAFRRLTDDDLPLLHAWLNEPGVVAWWEGEDVSWEGVVRDYGSANTDPTEHWIAVVDGEDAGWIQCYAWADYADEDETKAIWAAGVERGAAGIDYLVAEPGRRRRGVGSAMIGAFVDEIVFERHPEWHQVAAGPFVANTASWRALEKAGFRRLADYDAGEDEGPCRVMVRDRSATGSAPGTGAVDRSQGCSPA